MHKYLVTFSYTRYNKTHRRTVEYYSYFYGIPTVKRLFRGDFSDDYIDFFIEDIQEVQTIAG